MVREMLYKIFFIKIAIFLLLLNCKPITKWLYFKKHLLQSYLKNFFLVVICSDAKNDIDTSLATLLLRCGHLLTCKTLTFYMKKEHFLKTFLAIIIHTASLLLQKHSNSIL